MSGQKIKSNNKQVEYLGVASQYDLHWNSHLSNIKKVICVIGLLPKVRHCIFFKMGSKPK